MIDRLKENYGVVPRDMTTDGGYASLDNQQLAKNRGIVNIVFNKIVGSLKNLTSVDRSVYHCLLFARPILKALKYRLYLTRINRN